MSIVPVSSARRWAVQAGHRRDLDARRRLVRVERGPSSGQIADGDLHADPLEAVGTGIRRIVEPRLRREGPRGIGPPTHRARCVIATYAIARRMFQPSRSAKPTTVRIATGISAHNGQGTSRSTPGEPTDGDDEQPPSPNPANTQRSGGPASLRALRAGDRSRSISALNQPRHRDPAPRPAGASRRRRRSPRAPRRSPAGGR